MTDTDNTYTVRARWDAEDPAGSWTVTVDGHPGAVTFVRRLAELEATAAEALSVFLEHPVEPDETMVAEIKYPGRAGKLAANARVRRATAAAAVEQAQRVTEEAVVELAAEGLPSVTIGPLVGVSPQRVQQILHAYRLEAMSGQS